MLKRFALVTGLSVALIAGTGAPTSAAGGQITKETFDVSFELSSDYCSQIPEGTFVEGAGSMTVIINTHTNKGVTKLSIVAQSNGSATDQDGNEYVFHYGNIYNTQNSIAEPDIYRGVMVDQFSISGGGPANLSNGFRADIVENFDALTFEVTPVWIKGDPRSFPDLAVHCDPL
jgi:hypothetical protein